MGKELDAVDRRWPAQSVEMRNIDDLFPYANNSRTHSQQRGGEPVAWMTSDKRHIAFGDRLTKEEAAQHGWTPLYTAPQSAEPVRVPSDEDIERLASEHLSAHAQLVGAGEVHYEGEIEFARALLARYGHPAEPEGWQLVPKEPTEEMLVDAMEASLLGRPSADDDSYVRSIVKALCAAAPKFGEAL